jgi:hypothetical protein
MSNKTSVVICAYIYAMLLPHYLESLHSQPHPAEEIIEVDVNSAESFPLRICYTLKGSIRDNCTSKLLW